MLPWRGVDAMGDRFADLVEVREATGETSGAFVYDEVAETGELVPVAAAPTGTLTLSEQTYTDSFAVVGLVETSAGTNKTITVNANSQQLVIVTAKVTYDSGITVGSVTLPTPWFLRVHNDTTDPSITKPVGCGACGEAFAQAAIWAENTTDSDASQDINVSAYVAHQSTSDPLDCSLNVTFTVRTLYYA